MQPATEIVTDLDGSRLLSAQPQAAKGWSSGIFACCSHADTCCLSCWCPCVQFGQNQERGFQSQRSSCCRWVLIWMAPSITAYVLNTLIYVSACAQGCYYVPGWIIAVNRIIWICAMFTTAAIAGRRRALLRSQHQIGGSLELDIACHCCCSCCALAQEGRQIAHEEACKSRHEQTGVLPGAALPATPMAAVAEPVPHHASPTAAVPEAILAQPVDLPAYSQAADTV